MKPKKNTQRRGHTRHDAPKHDIIIVELNRVHLVLFHTKRLREPQAHIDQNQQSQQRPARLELFDVFIFSIHLQAIDYEYALKRRLEYRHYLQDQRQYLDLRLESFVYNRYNAVKAEQINARQADYDQCFIVVHAEPGFIVEIVQLELYVQSHNGYGRYND